MTASLRMALRPAWALAVVAMRLPAQEGPPQFRYVPELELADVDKRGGLRPALVDAESGLAVAAGADGKAPKGSPAFIPAREVDPATEALTQQHLRDVTILNPLLLNQKVRNDLGFAAGVDKTRKAIVLDRKIYLQRAESVSEVSNALGLIQGDEVFFGQLEMRWGQEGRTAHVVRTLQRAGPLLGTGFPTFVVAEMVHTATPNGMDAAMMARVLLVFARTQMGPPSARVHLGGDLRRLRGGAFETRKVHVISEFHPTGGSVSLKLWTSAGERYPYMSWETLFEIKHQTAWQPAGSGGATGSHEWERPYQPYAPARRGVRPMPIVSVLKLPANWDKGGYSGAPLQGKKLAIQQGQWRLAKEDYLVAGGVWQFDKKGQLVARTPFGEMDARQVIEFFKTQFAVAKGNEEETANLKSCLEVILEWAADLPQLPGCGPKEQAPEVRQFL